jgi:sporulation related protein
MSTGDSMADDRIQRPIRASQPPVRSAPGPSPTGASGSDPLAELARLIGQNDPFGEYGRQNARNVAQQVQHAHVPAYVDDRYPSPPTQYAPDNYPPQQFDGQQQYGAVPGYDPEGGYHRDADYPTSPHAQAEDHDFYDDVPPRRRLGIVAVAGVFALVVLGTAGAFGYRALFGSSGSKSPPPVIKADTSPSKIVPAAESKDPKSGKLIYDRVAERGQGEKIVSREEQPVDMNGRPAGAVTPQDQAGAPSGSIQPSLGSGVVATEPKKVHTIAIRPDGTEMASAAPSPAVATPQPPPPLAAPAPQRPQAAEQPAPPPRQQQARPEPPQPQRVAAPAPSAPSGNAPLSLSPDAQAQAAPVARRPVRTAAVAPPAQIAPAQAAQARATPASAPSSGGGGYAVQVSSQRSEADAQAAFRSLQSKFPSQLGGKQPMIHRVDLGAKGIYFRAMVGPFGSSEQASQMCSSLKAAGGQCIVQRI